MLFDLVSEVDEILEANWKPDEYGLLYHFANFSRLANSVISKLGEIQGWLGKVLWVVTRTLEIERCGHRILRFDLNNPVQSSVKCTSDSEGYIRVLLKFKLPPIFFGRSGYRDFVDV